MPAITAERAAQIARYLTVGVLSAIADIGGLWLLHGVLGVWLPMAAATSFLASFAVNFTLNQRWTFQAQTHRTPRQLVRFTVLVAVNTVLTSAGVTGLAAAGLNYLVAKVGVVILLTLINFVVLRLWVFRDADAAADAPTAETGTVTGG